MNSLRMLSFKSNQLQSIGYNSLNPNIVWLILTDNKIEILPDSIGKLSSLRKLMLAGNFLRDLPGQLSSCHQLELVRISCNRLTSIPKWLLELPRLSWLAFSGNDIPRMRNRLDVRIPEFRLEDFILLEKLGEGASGVIYKASLRDCISPVTTKNFPEHVAVKLYKSSITSDGAPGDEIDAAMAVGYHPNILYPLGQVVQSTQRGLLLPLVDHNRFTTLGKPPSFETITRDTFEPGRKFRLSYILNILVGVSAAMEHLSARGAVATHDGWVPTAWPIYR